MPLRASVLAAILAAAPVAHAAEDVEEVSFESEPEGASVSLDGKVICPKTPCRKLVPRGSHSVDMTLERHAPASTGVVVVEATTVSLQLVPIFGTLEVRTTPPGLDVTIDGNAMGQAPLAKRVDPGTYAVGVLDRCLAPTSQEVSVTTGEIEVVEIAPKPRLASVRISAVDHVGRSVPARVFAPGNDEPIGTTPDTIRLPVCTEELRFEGPGGVKASERVTLSDERTTELKVRFEGGSSDAEPANERRFAVRAGVGGHTGILGVGVEWRPSMIGLAVGTGTHLATLGVSLGIKGNEGGFYLDGHVALVRPGLFGAMPAEVDALSFGGSVGYDLRPHPAFSIKAGVGYAQNPASTGHLHWDLNMGPVF